MKKGLVLGLALSMMMSVMVGCGQTSTAAGSSNNAASANDEANTQTVAS